ncbi:MAG: hypothetical protein JWP87_4539 [Labilithrix sp.]|nr:hypothetical protein [Labilithrix sp.]
MSKPWTNVVVAAAAVAVGVTAWTWRKEPGPPIAPAPAAVHELTVPKVDAVPELDGELDDALWHGAVARTGAFLDVSGSAARPYSDARVVWGEGRISIALYAADADIRTRGQLRDEFRVTIGAVSFGVSATGELVGAPAGTRVGHDHDGTLDDPSDDDEEWVIELTVPLSELGLRGAAGERAPFAVDRCDTNRGLRSCSAARYVLVLAGKP